MRLKLITPQSLGFLLAFFMCVSTYTYSQKASYKIMESFEEELPSELHTIGGSIELDTLRMKHGRQSLKWNWEGNSKLILDRDLGYHPQRVIDLANNELMKGLRGGGKTGILKEPSRGILLWIYNPEARKQRLRFQFGKDDHVATEFDFNLNFKGWRTIQVMYDTGDMMGAPYEGMNRMTVLAPNIGKGTFYIDALGTSLPMNFRQNTPNPQLPNIDPHPRLVSNYEHRLYEWSKNLPTMEVVPLTTEKKSELEKMDAFIEEFLLDKMETDKTIQSALKSIQKRYSKYKIQRKGNEIFGRPLMSDNIYTEYFTNAGLPNEALKNQFEDWKNYSTLMCDIASLYQRTEEQNTRAELSTLFINLFDYGVDQGIDTGAGLMWIHHYAYRLGKMPISIFLMRKVLEEEGRLDKAIEITKWFFGFNQVYNESVVYGVEGRKGIDADDAHGILLGKLLSAMSMPNSAEKDRDLRQFSSYFTNVAAHTSNGIDDGLKPDGTAFHHAIHILSYGGRLITSMGTMLYLLSDTPYRAGKSAHVNIKRAVNTLFHIQGPTALSAPTTYATTRFKIEELPKETHLLPAYLALCGNPETNDVIDKEMADYAFSVLEKSENGYFHYYDKRRTNKNANSEKNVKVVNPVFEKFRSKIKVKYPKVKATNYNGIKILPFSASASKRLENTWLTSVRAHSKYVVPFESWATTYFGYPLFIANGYLDVAYPNSIDSTTPHSDEKKWFDGYDWHNWPGTTTVRLPFKEMVTSPESIRDEGGEYLFSDQSFCGGVSSNNGNGIFSFILKGHDKYNLESLRAKKSYFMFGDKIICLGSDIQSDLSGLPVETTLFQDALTIAKNPTQTNFMGDVSDFPVNKTILKANNQWFLDSRGSGFYVNSIEGNSKLKFDRTKQTAPNVFAEKEVSGNFAKAYFDHGTQPKAAKYAYTVIPYANKDKLNIFAEEMASKKPPIKIIQQDEKAHVVHSTKLNTTGYATFINRVDFKKGIVKSIESPSILMVEEKSKHKIELNVVNPDLNIYDGQDDLLPNGKRTELSIYEREWFFWPSRPTYTTITLKGIWKIEEGEKHSQNIKEIIYSKKNSLLRVMSLNGISETVVLVKK
ncbi:chondroitinase family polysaccharide lyase [Lutibacter citreus]|uniref:chondroitinase family polysaccharide lyase n=1 Tax=Lutibacter citreus TaxID=2138210 RepID=UPI000DBEAAE3|nr:chondroitinase family polysaccharide lyase [Lutibacter citreus]